MNRLAPDPKWESALHGDGARFTLGEYWVRRFEEDVLELARPWSETVVEDLDAPHLTVFEGPADGFVDLPVSGLALLGL